MFSLLELLPDSFLLDILDVGASFNPEETAPYQRLVEVGRARLTGFEPNREACDHLTQVYPAPHRFFPYFIGDGEPAIFHETNQPQTGSLFAPNTPLLRKFQNLAEVVTPVAEHPVQTKRLDDLPEIGNVDFFKIDVQGAELSVFSGARRVLQQALVICAEVNFVELYKGQPLFSDVDCCLRGSGFQFHRLHEGFGSRVFKPLVYAGNLNSGGSQQLWADAIYVRDWMALDRLDAVKLLKYAVLAHDLLGSYDLAHLVLSEFDRQQDARLASSYLKRLAGA